MMDDQLAKTQYLAGDAFSYGDIPVGIMAYRFVQLIPERPAMPHLDRWYAAISSRPAFKEQVAVGAADLTREPLAANVRAETAGATVVVCKVDAAARFRSHETTRPHLCVRSHGRNSAVNVRAQQTPAPVVGFLNSGSPDTSAQQTAAFRQGLADGGFVEGRNVAIEFRWARGDYNRLPEMADALIRRPVAVLLAGGPPAARAAKPRPRPFRSCSRAATIRSGRALSTASAARVGNLTGVHIFLTGLEAKRLGLMREIVPKADVIGVARQSAFSRCRGSVART